MSELIHTNDNRATIRWKLLTGASALALMAYVSSAALARAEDSSQPQIWIELGGGFEQLSNQSEAYAPPFMASVAQHGLLNALAVQSPPAYGIDEEAKITFQPTDSDWVFAASIRYGRSQANRHRHQQTANAKIPVDFVERFPPGCTTSCFLNKYYNYSLYPSMHAKFADGQSQQSEKHTIIDFKVGKDVGLGMFDLNGTSVVSAGVRFAQLRPKSNVTMHALPDLQYQTAPIDSKYEMNQFKNAPVDFHAYSASEETERSFQGVGPEISWDASTPVAGNAGDGSGTLFLDWGLNAGILFGRQQARVHHETKTQSYHMTQFKLYRGNGASLDGHHIALVRGRFVNPSAGKCGTAGDPQYCNYFPTYAYTGHATSTQVANKDSVRSRNVAVPNLGAFAGISYRYADAKISLGYRADFFFNAIDGGIDTRKEENRGFFGPYASISIGIGD